MDERSDRDLVTASCGGDRTAYAGLVRRHYGHVFLVCLGVLGNIHDAEDVAQDAMIKGFEQIRQLRDGDQFGGWIVAIARNLSINQLRKRKAMEKTLVPRPPETRRPSPATGPPAGGGPAAVGPEAAAGDVLLRRPGREDGRREARDSTSGVYLKLRNAIKELHEMLTTQGDTP